MSTFQGDPNIPKTMQRILREWNQQQAVQLEMTEIFELHETRPLNGKLGEIYPETVLYPATRLDHVLPPPPPQSSK